jgi:hypothetical protein
MRSLFLGIIGLTTYVATAPSAAQVVFEDTFEDRKVGAYLSEKPPKVGDAWAQQGFAHDGTMPYYPAPADPDGGKMFADPGSRTDALLKEDAAKKTENAVVLYQLNVFVQEDPKAGPNEGLELISFEGVLGQGDDRLLSRGFDFFLRRDGTLSYWNGAEFVPVSASEFTFPREQWISVEINADYSTGTATVKVLDKSCTFQFDPRSNRVDQFIFINAASVGTARSLIDNLKVSILPKGQ